VTKARAVALRRSHDARSHAIRNSKTATLLRAARDEHAPRALAVRAAAVVAMLPLVFGVDLIAKGLGS
jgi:hypothetical protein